MADCWACQVDRATIRALTTLGTVEDLCEPCAVRYGRRRKPPRNKQKCERPAVLWRAVACPLQPLSQEATDARDCTPN